MCNLCISSKRLAELVFVLWVLPKHDSLKACAIFISITTLCVALFLYQDWQPPFACDVRNFRFTPRIQRLNELEVSLSGWWWLRRWSPPFMNECIYTSVDFWILNLPLRPSLVSSWTFWIKLQSSGNCRGQRFDSLTWKERFWTSIDSVR